MIEKVLVTGASGFVGSALVAKLLNENRTNVRASTRKNTQALVCEIVRIENIDANTDWSEALNDIDCVIHVAARAHVMNDKGPDALSRYRSVNVEGSINLAKQASDLGITRFIFISSIKVNGERTAGESAYAYDDDPAPEDYYGQSKYEAEEALKELTNDSKMELVIIRPPLVYGPGVKGNFARLIKLCAKPVPLPLGAIYNSRSLVGLDNLIDLVITCIRHKNAAGKTFLVSDDDDVSTTELINRIGIAMGKKLWVLPIPKWLMLIAAKLSGKSAAVDRLFGSLQVDISYTKDQLSWSPPFSMGEQLERTIAEMKIEVK